jgi:hypothetical protein
MPFPEVHLSKDELRQMYLEQIAPNPEFYCLLTFDVHKEGDRNCLHEWKKTVDADDHGIWECSKCGAKAGCDLGD